MVFFCMPKLYVGGRKAAVCVFDFGIHGAYLPAYFNRRLLAAGLNRPVDEFWRNRCVGGDFVAGAAAQFETPFGDKQGIQDKQ